MNDTILQLYSLPAVAVGGEPATSFYGASSAIDSVNCSIAVTGEGVLLIDFGIELPAWLEMDSHL